MSARQLQSNESIKSYFEIIKDKYDNLDDFINDYPIYSSLIKEIFISTPKIIDSTLTFNDLKNDKIRCFNDKGEYVLFGI